MQLGLIKSSLFRPRLFEPFPVDDDLKVSLSKLIYYQKSLQEGSHLLLIVEIKFSVCSKQASKQNMILHHSLELCNAGR